MMPLTRLLAASFLLLSVSLFVQPSVAENWNERDKLAAIVEELARLESLIDEASVHADRDARIRFRYDWLRRDLKRIRQGIEDHLDAPDTDPRAYPPIRGNYRQ